LKKTPLVLVPGLLCDALLWQPQIEGLADLADCWVADPTRHETMADIAAAILADSPFTNFALAGLSMGGYIAFEVVRRAPNRVRKLALLDTVPAPDTPERIEGRQKLMAAAARGKFVGVTDSLIRLFVHPSRVADAPLIAVIRTMARNVGKRGFLRQERAIIGRADSRPMLRSIACPTLVLCGREDAVTPLAAHEEMALAIPGAELEVIEHCGHLSTLERPTEVNAALERWLARS
jgi:pimeloyl-ACP methyl ester carboxylesterase